MKETKCTKERRKQNYKRGRTVRKKERIVGNKRGKKKN